MMKKTAVLVSAPALVLALCGAAVSADGHRLLARFDGGIGVQPVGALTPSPTPGGFANATQNFVRGVAPAGGPWTIASLKAEVDTDGNITVRGRGLVLAGGNRLGQSLQLGVAATLICDAVPFVEHTTTTLTQLDRRGDFRIDDTLLPVPGECSNPVLLIRSGFTGPWLAAAIPQPADE
jgi:hypothetical protein